jgi:hypothetical protein
MQKPLLCNRMEVSSNPDVRTSTGRPMKGGLWGGSGDNSEETVPVLIEGGRRHREGHGKRRRLVGELQGPALEHAHVGIFIICATHDAVGQSSTEHLIHCLQGGARKEECREGFQPQEAKKERTRQSRDGSARVRSGNHRQRGAPELCSHSTRLLFSL